MAINLINIGNIVNDGLGDDLRTAFQKVNANFQSLESSLTITASTLGTTGAEVFKQKNGLDLEFRRLVSGTKILLDQTSEAIVINNTSPDAFTRIDTNSGLVEASTYGQITIQGGPDIDVTAFGSVISVNNVLPVTDILTTFDFGPISGHFSNAIQLSLAASNIDFGTFEYPSSLALDLGSLV
jgi:hypothetical protein